MKNTIYILSMILIGLVGCDDFLEEENKSNVTAEGFYITEEGYEALINANYAALREIHGQDPWLFCAGTDLYTDGRETAPVGLGQYSELTASASDVDFLYINCFKAIQQANLAISYNELTEPTSNISELMGEMEYMRANAYFLLVQTYGGVSLITEAIDAPITSYDRSSAEQVYTQIVTDLENALSSVSNTAYNGRVNQRAVQHLLAKVHLTRAYESFGPSTDFATAASYADDAINGQSLNLTFEELWTPGNEMNEEVIFSVQYSAGSIGPTSDLKGSKQQNYFGSYLGGSEVAGNAPWKQYALCPTRFALDLFVQGDTRWDATFMTQVYSRYYDYFDEADKSGLTVAHFYEPSWFTPADKTAYQLANPSAVYHDYGTHDPEGADVSNNFNTIIVKKFDDPASAFAGSAVDNRSSTRDYVFARLGETYLIAAEAYLGAGQAPTGLSRLNTVRERAFGGAGNNLASIDIDVVLDERARELLGEYHRWFDLKRTGKLVERASAHNMNVDASNFNGVGGELKILRPIPQSALDLNQNLDFPQNPAYN